LGFFLETFFLNQFQRGKAGRDIGQGAQDQHPREKEMDRPVPNRGADDEGKWKIDEGRSSYRAGFPPIQPRVRDENAAAADEQTNNACRHDPVGDAHNRHVPQ